MANPRNGLTKKQAMVEARRAKVASYKVRGFSIRETVEALAKDGCVNPRTGKPWAIHAIHDDIRELEARWRESSMRDISEAKAAELAKLDELERAAWTAWEKSRGEKTTKRAGTRTGGRAAGSTASMTTSEEAGDPRFLAVVLDCHKRRCTILGLDAPQKIAPTTPDGEPLPTGGTVIDHLPLDLLIQVRDAAKKGRKPAED